MKILLSAHMGSEPLNTLTVRVSCPEWPDDLSVTHSRDRQLYYAVKDLIGLGLKVAVVDTDDLSGANEVVEAIRNKDDRLINLSAKVEKSLTKDQRIALLQGDLSKMPESYTWHLTTDGGAIYISHLFLQNTLKGTEMTQSQYLAVTWPKDRFDHRKVGELLGVGIFNNWEYNPFEILVSFPVFDSRGPDGTNITARYYAAIDVKKTLIERDEFDDHSLWAPARQAIRFGFFGDHRATK